MQADCRGSARGGGLQLQQAGTAAAPAAPRHLPGAHRQGSRTVLGRWLRHLEPDSCVLVQMRVTRRTRQMQHPRQSWHLRQHPQPCRSHRTARRPSRALLAPPAWQRCGILLRPRPAALHPDPESDTPLSAPQTASAARSRSRPSSAAQPAPKRRRLSRAAAQAAPAEPVPSVSVGEADQHLLVTLQGGVSWPEACLAHRQAEGPAGCYQPRAGRACRGRGSER